MAASSRLGPHGESWATRPLSIHEDRPGERLVLVETRDDRSRLAKLANLGLWLVLRRPRAQPERIHRIFVGAAGLEIEATTSGARTARRWRVPRSEIAAVRLRIGAETGKPLVLRFQVHAADDLVGSCQVSGLDLHAEAEDFAARFGRALGLSHRRIRRHDDSEIDIELAPAGGAGPYRADLEPMPELSGPADYRLAPEARDRLSEGPHPAGLNEVEGGARSFTIVEPWKPGHELSFARRGAAEREKWFDAALRLGGAAIGASFSGAGLGLAVGVLTAVVLGLPWILVSRLLGPEIMDPVGIGVIAVAALSSAGWLAVTVFPTYAEPVVPNACRVHIDAGERTIAVEEAGRSRNTAFDEVLAVTVHHSGRRSRIDLVLRDDDVRIFEHESKNDDPEPKARREQLVERLAEVVASTIGAALERPG